MNSKTFLLELNSGAFGNQLVWTSCKHGNACKTVFLSKLRVCKLSCLCFVLCVESLVMLLYRFGANFNNISGSKMSIWKRNSMPQANNMDAKHCAGQTLILDFQ